MGKLKLSNKEGGYASEKTSMKIGMEKEENKKEELQEEIEKEEKTENVPNDSIKEELDNTTDRLKRLMAEFDNFKKRNAKERENLYASILGDIACKLLPVLDNLEKAVSSETEDTNYKQGIELVLKQYIDVLASFGITQIESVGKTFNPEFHEAVSMVQDENLGEKEIKEEYRKGYKIGDKVIRHSMVIVAN